MSQPEIKVTKLEKVKPFDYETLAKVMGLNEQQKQKLKEITKKK